MINSIFSIVLAGSFDQNLYAISSILQKAEAQAREAQIQAALERVRARTMAMQRSDELAEVANIIISTGESIWAYSTWRLGFNVWE